MPVTTVEIWDTAETAPPTSIRELQTRRLRECIRRAAKVPFYGLSFDKLGLGPESIDCVDDVRRFPFTTKADLRDHYPLGLLAVDKTELARIHGSSGTTGKPTFVGYTADDLDSWAGLCARFLFAAGLRRHHLVHVAFGYGLFTGGFGLHYGIERVGASVVPISSGNTSRQLMLLQDLAPDALVCTPSYALTIADAARTQGIDARQLALKFAFLGGEPWTEDMRVEIESSLHLSAFNNYGLSEIVGPGVSGECAQQAGMHVQEDHFLVECVDPDTLQPVADGDPGELVFTTLTRQAMPLIRYRTRDISSLNRTPCPCGRTTTRMSRIRGRSDDMLIIRGVNVFPTQIEEALLRSSGTSPHYMIEVTRCGTLDEITVRVEVDNNTICDSNESMRAVEADIGQNIFATTGLRARIELTRPQTLERFEGKANRVLDRRPKPSAETGD